MSNIKKRPSKRLISQVNFEEIDHRLSCGWHAEVEGNAQRKKYFKEIRKDAQSLANTKSLIKSEDSHSKKH